jgi:hypothetical protein
MIHVYEVFPFVEIKYLLDDYLIDVLIKSLSRNFLNYQIFTTLIFVKDIRLLIVCHDHILWPLKML